MKRGKYIRTKKHRELKRIQNSGKNNPHYGKKHSEKTKNQQKIKKLAEKNPMWKGKNVGYNALHEWIKNRIKKPKLCQNCNKKPPIDLANISQKYKRELKDWEWLCRKCHMIKDGRLTKLINSKNHELDMHKVR